MGSPRAPKPLIAAILTLLSPGLGHLYVGERRWFFGALIALPFYFFGIFSALVYLPGLVGLGLAAMLVLCWFVFWPWHAYRVASTSGSHLRSGGPVRAWQLLVAGLLTYGWLQLIVVLSPLHTFVATSGSMEPTLLPGDHFIMLPTRREGPRLEDVALYNAPDMDGPVIGRVVALGSDVVEMRGGVFFRNGEAETGAYVYRSGEDPEFEPTEWGPLQVPPGHVFILGDHRDMSYDSRQRGPIPVDQVFGRAVRIHFSRSPYRLLPRWERIGRVPG